MCRDCYHYGVHPRFLSALHAEGETEFGEPGSFWGQIFNPPKPPGATVNEGRKNEPILIQQLIKKGNKDENDLTNQIFFNRHPELGRKKLLPNQPGFAQLSKEWIDIRDTLVRPNLRRAVRSSPSISELDRYLTKIKTLIPFIERDRGNIPLAFILAWIRIESGGDITVIPKYQPGHKDLNERGYFQISLEESAKQGFQHARLSFDPQYSIQAGIKLINYYANSVRALGVTDSNPIFWRLVKLWHAASGIATYAVRFVKEKGVPIYNWEVFKKFILETEWNNFEKRLASFKNIADKRSYVIRLFNNVDHLFQWAALIQPAISS